MTDRCGRDDYEDGQGEDQEKREGMKGDRKEGKKNEGSDGEKGMANKGKGTRGTSRAPRSRECQAPVPGDGGRPGGGECAGREWARRGGEVGATGGRADEARREE